jgi:hypothetical protein
MPTHLTVRQLFQLSAAILSAYTHRWARLLKQQTSITVYYLPKTSFQKTNGEFAVSAFRLQQMNGSCRFPLVIFKIMLPFQTENGNSGNFP